MEPHTKIGCEAYIIRENKVLLYRRGDGDWQGSWSLPGGHLEFMERVDEGIIRELREELDISVVAKDVTLIAITDDLRPTLDQHYLHITFRVDIGNQEPKSNEPDKCAELKWFPVDALPENIFPYHARVFETLKAKQLYL